MIVISTYKNSRKRQIRFHYKLDGNTVLVESLCVSDLLSHMKDICFLKTFYQKKKKKDICFDWQNLFCTLYHFLSFDLKMRVCMT